MPHPKHGRSVAENTAQPHESLALESWTILAHSLFVSSCRFRQTLRVFLGARAEKNIQGVSVVHKTCHIGTETWNKILVRNQNKGRSGSQVKCVWKSSTIQHQKVLVGYYIT